MKKKSSFILILLLCLFLSTGTVVSKSASQQITAWFYEIQVILDGKSLMLATQPFIYNNHTYVSINDVAKNLGYTVQWDDKSKTMNLSSSSSDQVALSTMKYELDRKNAEINSLKYQLEQKNLELSILKENREYASSSSQTTLSGMENILDDDFYRYSDDDVSMRFSFSLGRQSNEDIIVRMYGNFDRTSSTWRNRYSSDFRSYILGICKEIDYSFNDDVIVYVYDEDDDWIADYKYSDSNNRITSYSEY